jgi:hypothetical protein
LFQYVNDGQQDDTLILDNGKINHPSDDEYAEQTHPSKRRCQDEDAEEVDPNPAVHNMHPCNPGHFFKLSPALKILMSLKLQTTTLKWQTACCVNIVWNLLRYIPLPLNDCCLVQEFPSALQAKCDQTKPPLLWSCCAICS